MDFLVPKLCLYFTNLFYMLLDWALPNVSVGQARWHLPLHHPGGFQVHFVPSQGDQGICALQFRDPALRCIEGLLVPGHPRAGRGLEAKGPEVMNLLKVPQVSTGSRLQPIVISRKHP